LPDSFDQLDRFLRGSTSLPVAGQSGKACTGKVVTENEAGKSYLLVIEGPATSSFHYQGFIG
jgi:hypothetical protein